VECYHVIRSQNTAAYIQHDGNCYCRDTSVALFLETSGGFIA